MIGKLKGTVEEIGDGEMILDVNGVGYVLHCSTRTLAGLPPAGEPVSMLVETVVREDMIRLYGFATKVEREWFTLLQTVQSVGAKVALALQSTLAPDVLASAIVAEDKAAVSRAPGVGPRLAARIVSELKGKVPDHLVGVAPAPGAAAAPVSQAAEEAASALLNLGYPRAQALAAVAKASEEAGEGAETKVLIRIALRTVSRAA